MNILCNTVLKLGGTKYHFKRVKLPGTTPYWKAEGILTVEQEYYNFHLLSMVLSINWPSLIVPR